MGQCLRSLYPFQWHPESIWAPWWAGGSKRHEGGGLGWEWWVLKARAGVDSSGHCGRMTSLFIAASSPLRLWMTLYTKNRLLYNYLDAVYALIMKNFPGQIRDYL